MVLCRGTFHGTLISYDESCLKVEYFVLKRDLQGQTSYFWPRYDLMPLSCKYDLILFSALYRITSHDRIADSRSESPYFFMRFFQLVGKTREKEIEKKL